MWSVMFIQTSQRDFGYPFSIFWGIANHSFPYTNPHQTEIINITVNGDYANPCTFWIMNDISFILYLCSPFCLACTSYQLCTLCGTNGTGHQLYLNNNTNTSYCTPGCNYSYYTSPPPTLPQLFECDVCDISCFTCSVPASYVNCTSCNNLGGYRFKYNSSSVCVQSCEPGQYATGTPMACQLCSSNCQ